MKSRANIQRRQYTPRVLLAAHWITHQQIEMTFLTMWVLIEKFKFSMHYGPNIPDILHLSRFFYIWQRMVVILSSIDTRVLFLAYFPDARSSEKFDAISEDASLLTPVVILAGNAFWGLYPLFKCLVQDIISATTTKRCCKGQIYGRGIKGWLSASGLESAMPDMKHIL